MTNEPLYTLKEAQQIFNARYCLSLGHELCTVESGENTPIIFCERCGKRWVEEKP